MPIECPRRKGLSVILGGSMLLNQFIVQTEDEHCGSPLADKERLIGMCCNFVVEPKLGLMIGILVRRREQTENEVVQ
jgi:hypothetical protein